MGSSSDSAPPPSSDVPDDAVCSKAKWSRPKPPSIDPKTDEITFQQMDTDHYVGDPREGMPGSKESQVAVIRMFGLTADHNSA